MADKPSRDNRLTLSKTSLEFDTVRLIADIRAFISAFEVAQSPALRDMEAVSGISASTFSRLDNGNKPDMDTFMRMCESFSLEPAHYFIWIDWSGAVRGQSDD